MNSGTPRVAVAASGLGHVARGIEAWAQDLTAALQRRNVPVRLFGGAAGPGIVPVSCFQRASQAARRISGLFQYLGGWHYGLGSDYDVEQTSFAWQLWRHIRNDFDILHVQDPTVASILDRLNRAKLSRPRVILANGTGESTERLASLSVVQELSPLASSRWDDVRGNRPQLFSVPNFIDMETFAPGDKQEARRQLGLPADALIVLSCAAIRRFHKRIDYLLQEFAHFTRAASDNVLLVVAGGRELDTEELVATGNELLGQRVRFIVAGPRSNMPILYRAADIFVLASLHEMGSIALMEALASGLPIICNDVPSFHFQAGPSNRYVNMENANALAAAISDLAASSNRMNMGSASRAYAQATFSEAVVIDRILEMYDTIVAPQGAVTTRAA